MDKFLNSLNIDIKNIQLEAPEVFAVGGKNFEVEKKLASGAFADVFLVHNDGGSKFVAKKQLMNEHTNALVTREIKLMKQFDHRNLVRFLGAGRVPDSAYVVIIMELCAGGALFDLLEKRKPRGALTEAGVLKIVSDCVAGVKYMHDLGLAHWDIKLENILQGQDNVFKLCDFGSVMECPLPCRTPDEWGLLEDKIGQFTSESYRAPEMCDNFGVSELTVKTDVWALGSIVYACCFFTLPFMNQGKLGILNGKYPVPAGHKFSPGLMKIIDRCFQLRPKYRADCEELAERVLALQEKREPNVAEVSASPRHGPTAASTSQAERRARSKAAAQARLDKKKAKSKKQQQRQQPPAAAAAAPAAVSFDVDWDAAGGVPTPKHAASSVTASPDVDTVADKWDVEFVDGDDAWADVEPSSAPGGGSGSSGGGGGGGVATAAAAPATAPAPVQQQQSDDWVDWDTTDDAGAAPAPAAASRDAGAGAPRKPSADAADDWDAFASGGAPASAPSGGGGGGDNLAEDLFAGFDAQPQQQQVLPPQFHGGRGGPNLNLMSTQQRQAYQLRMQQQQWQQQQLRAQQLGGASAISAMLGPAHMRRR